MKIIGVMRINDSFAEHCHLTIELASRFCDGICFVTNQVERPEVLDAIAGCQNLLEMRETASPWSHEVSFHEAYELGILQGAEWVLMADHDEILPYAQLPQQIDAAERDGKMVITFPFLNCWGSPATIVDPSLNVTGKHGKLFKCGIKDFRESSFCVPAGYWDSLYDCSYPLRHCHMMTKELRARRLHERGTIEPWALEEPPTLPFVPDLTIESYRKHFLRKLQSTQ